MPLNRLLNAQRLYADISLRHRRAAVLQEPLDKGNVKAVIVVNLRGAPFPEVVGGYPLIAQIVKEAFGSFCTVV